jgi:hypothetical protein
MRRQPQAPSGFVAQITTRKLKSPIGFVFSTPQHTAVLRPNKQLGSFLQTPPDGFIAQTPGSSKSGFAKNAFSSPFALTWCSADPIRRHAPPPSFPEITNWVRFCRLRRMASLRKPPIPANLVSQKTPFLRLLR